jgi:hypothetical protein
VSGAEARPTSTSWRTRPAECFSAHPACTKDRRLFPEAWRKFEQILNITPDDVDTIVEGGDRASRGRLAAGFSTVGANWRPTPTHWKHKLTRAILERRPAQIMSRLKEY